MGILGSPRPFYLLGASLLGLSIPRGALVGVGAATTPYGSWLSILCCGQSTRCVPRGYGASHRHGNPVPQIGIFHGWSCPLGLGGLRRARRTGKVSGVEPCPDPAAPEHPFVLPIKLLTGPIGV